MKWISTIFLFFIICTSANAQGNDSRLRSPDQYVSTIGGELRVSQREDVDVGFNVSLNGKVILRTDADDEGNVYKRTPFVNLFSIYKGYRLNLNQDGIFNEYVLLMFYEGGNACPSGNFQFLIITDSKTYSFSNTLEACVEPIITFDVGKAIFHFPREPFLRGTGFMPAETWVFEKEFFKKIKPSSNKRKSK